MRSLTTSWTLGGRSIANRVVLAPLAGIGNWFVRLQAKRHGAGLVVSEMVSSFGLKYGDPRTEREFLRIHPEEHPMSVQLFGHDADVMRVAAEKAAAAGADLIDINMGCPVKKVCKTGAGAALLEDHEKAVAIARAARDGSGLPVTVKLRPGHRPGERNGVVLARRLVEEAGVAGIAFHPRHASQQHKGRPDYALARELVEALEVPVIVSGGLSDEDATLRAFDESGADAVMLARGSLGNPWRFERLLGLREDAPTRTEICDELLWVVDRGEEHLGVERAGRYLRKFYPWYADTMGLTKRERNPLVTAPTTDDARRAIRGIARLPDSSGPPHSPRGFSMPKELVLTKQGLDELKAKIEYLQNERRREVAARIKEAREFGDISENAEYDDAKNEQAMLEKQISDLEEKLRSAKVIDSKEVTGETVTVGTTVHVKDQKSGKSVKYHIVGSAEANIAESKLSNESPIGKALLGKKRNDIVSVPIPRGPARKLKITKIEAG